MASVAPVVTSTSSSGENVEPVPGRLVRGDGGPQLGHALARRVLVAPGRDGLGRHLGQLGRPVGVGKALAQVEGTGGHGQLGHLREDRRREGPEPLGEDVRGSARHAHDGTGGLSSGRTVLTVANFNMHAGVDGWGRPFDPIAACAALRRRRPRARGVLDQRRRRARVGAGRTDRRRARLPGRDVHRWPRAGWPRPTPTPPTAGCPAWASGPTSGRSTLAACAPSRHRELAVGPLPARREPGQLGDRRPHAGATWRWRDTHTAPPPAAAGPGAPGRHRGGPDGRGRAPVRLSAPTCPTCSTGRTATTHALNRLLRTEAQTRRRAAGRHEPVGAAGAGLPARLAPGREGADLAGLEPPQPDRPHSGPRRRAGRLRRRCSPPPAPTIARCGPS